MPSSRKIVSYRPDEVETELLSILAKKRGLPASRLIGTALREMAQRDSVPIPDVLTNKEKEVPTE